MQIKHKVIKPFSNQKCVIACSGGVDSVALLHFLHRHNDIKIVHINHDQNNAFDNACEKLVRDLAIKYNLPIDVYYITETFTNNIEQQQRDFRHNVFKNYDENVYLGHTLDDQVEEYIMSMLKGNVRYIPYKRNNLRRPLLFLKKEELYEYANYHKLSWLEDHNNYNDSNQRSFCRNKIVPLAFNINKGLYKTVAKLSAISILPD